MNIALSLNHDAKKLAEFYDKWASYYDQDVSDGFMLPTMMLSALNEAVAKDATALGWARDPQALVMDAGCGTGAVGKVYAQAGYKIVDGVDISNEMVEKARATGGLLLFAFRVCCSRCLLRFLFTPVYLATKFVRVPSGFACLLWFLDAPSLLPLSFPQHVAAQLCTLQARTEP